MKLTPKEVQGKPTSPPGAKEEEEEEEEEGGDWISSWQPRTRSPGG